MKDSRNLTPKISVTEDRIYIYRDVIRLLGNPAFVCLLENEDRHSIAFSPCEESHAMSFRVPERLLAGEKCDFRIHCKDFIAGLKERYHLTDEAKYIVLGKYVPEHNAVAFCFDDQPVNI